MTVKEFREEAVDRGPYISELRRGEVIRVVRPKLKHWRLQYRLADLLRPLVEPTYLVGIELAFRALPEHELRAADVAVISRARFDAADDDDNIRGAPEIVIEILSPSNTVSEMQEREDLCLANGSEEFWVVDAKAKTIRCCTSNRLSKVYGSGDLIVFLGDRQLQVARVFEL